MSSPASPPFPACLRVEVTYAWPRDHGTVGSDREPVALFTGEAVHAYLGHLSDAAIEAMLNELATELGAALGQERIYVAFADRTWILDAGEQARTLQSVDTSARTSEQRTQQRVIQTTTRTALSCGIAGNHRLSLRIIRELPVG